MTTNSHPQKNFFQMFPTFSTSPKIQLTIRNPCSRSQTNYLVQPSLLFPLPSHLKMHCALDKLFPHFRLRQVRRFNRFNV